MPERSEANVFLERSSYRRRRLLDALKLLPVFGAWVFLLPVFWPTNSESGASWAMSSALIFIFGAWAVLVLVSAFILRRLNRLEQRAATSKTPS